MEPLPSDVLARRRPPGPAQGSQGGAPGRASIRSPKESTRPMAALLQMQKLDLAALKRAYEQAP